MRIILVALCSILFTLPHASFAAEGGFTIEPGDVLQITVWKEEGLDLEVLVLHDGTITFPLIGSLNVQGMSLSFLKSTVKNKLHFSIPDASVTVTVKAPLGHKVSILGQVQAPGEVVMSASTSVIQALSQVGGLTPFADERKIVIIRKTESGKKSIKYPYNDIVRGRDLEKDIDLQPGDVVFVPSSGLF